MEIKCLEVRKINGVEVTQFKPTPGMRLFALSAICDPLCSGKDPEEICKSIGLGKTSYSNFLKFEPYFSEWLDEVRLALGGKSKKHLLEMVGFERALAGEFNFWKPLAIREGVISEDKLNVGLSLPANLGAFKGMTDEQFDATENSIMDSLRGQANAGEITLLESDSGWKQEGDSFGVDEVLQKSVVLADDVGIDGKCRLEEIERF